MHIYRHSGSKLQSYKSLLESGEISLLTSQSYGTADMYYHFLFSFLLPLLDLSSLGFNRKPKFLVETLGAFSRFRRELAREGILDIEVRAVLKAPFVRLEDYDPYFDTRMGLVFRPCALDSRKIVSVVQPILAKVDPVESDILIIQREGGSGDRCHDMAEISAKLHYHFPSLRIRLVALHDLSIIEQASIFRGADTIIGEHGSGLANLVWCKSTTNCIEVCPETMMRTPFYQLLCFLKGMNHARIPIDDDSPNKIVSIIQKGRELRHGHTGNHYTRMPPLSKRTNVN